MPGHLCLQIGSFVALAALSAPVVLWFKWTLHSMVSETEREITIKSLSSFYSFYSFYSTSVVEYLQRL